MSAAPFKSRSQRPDYRQALCQNRPDSPHPREIRCAAAIVAPLAAPLIGRELPLGKKCWENFASASCRHCQTANHCYNKAIEPVAGKHTRSITKKSLAWEPGQRDFFRICEFQVDTRLTIWVRDFKPCHLMLARRRISARLDFTNQPPVRISPSPNGYNRRLESNCRWAGSRFCRVPDRGCELGRGRH